MRYGAKLAKVYVTVVLTTVLLVSMVFVLTILSAIPSERIAGAYMVVKDALDGVYKENPTAAHISIFIVTLIVTKALFSLVTL